MQQEIPVEAGSFSNSVAEEYVEQAVELFNKFGNAENNRRVKACEREQEEKDRLARQAEYEKNRAEATSKMLISSGFSFEGYRIVKYSGYISGDDCVTMPRDDFWGSNKVDENLCGALVKIRRQALKS